MTAATNKITVKAFEGQRVFKDVVNINSAKTYKINFKPWAEENNDVSAVSWTVKAGQSTISNESLSSNVANALITFGNVGLQLIEVKATTASEVFIWYLEVLVKDLSADLYFSDYR